MGVETAILGRGSARCEIARLVMTRGEMIKDVDVGSCLDPRFSDERIPTIEATFAAMKGHPTWLCFVDEKGAGPKYIAEKAVEAGVQDQVYYTGPSHETRLCHRRQS